MVHLPLPMLRPNLLKISESAFDVRFQLSESIMAPRAGFARQQGPMAVAAVPRFVVRLSVTEALCFHPFGPEQAFGGVDFASGFPWRAHARIPR
jgi:hypothetical protein